MGSPAKSGMDDLTSLLAPTVWSSLQILALTVSKMATDLEKAGNDDLLKTLSAVEARVQSLESCSTSSAVRDLETKTQNSFKEMFQKVANQFGIHKRIIDQLAARLEQVAAKSHATTLGSASATGLDSFFTTMRVEPNLDRNTVPDRSLNDVLARLSKLDSIVQVHRHYLPPNARLSSTLLSGWKCSV